MNELALFAGAGGGILGGHLLRWRTVCAVEIDSFCRRILLARQRDGMLPRFPIWDDVRTFDGKFWRGHVDVISGGFPCQDISSAGKRAGIEGERSGLWKHFARVIGEVRPKFAFIENSPHLRTRGLVTVLQDLARLGYDARWGVLGAKDVGAPHIRKRMWIVASKPDMQREREFAINAQMAGASQDARAYVTDASDAERDSLWKQQGRSGRKDWQDEAFAGKPAWWPVDIVQGMDDGMANRMDKVRATGNGQVPGVAALAWRILNQ